MAFLNALPGAVEQGLIWGLMAIGVYISYKVLDIADLTVDGSFATGGCVCAVMIIGGVPAWISVILAFIAGAASGVITGLLHTALGIPSILAGILTQLMLYSINLAVIMDGERGKTLIYGTHKTLISGRVNLPSQIESIIIMTAVIAAVIIILWLFFYTEVGLTLKSTGDNPDMSRAQGINVSLNKVIGLAVSNGIVALAGAFYAQYNSQADITYGSGAIVTGLAAIFIGLSVSLKIKPNFVVSLIGVVGGGIIYYLIFTFVVSVLGLPTDYLKLLTAAIVILFLSTPYLKGRYFTRQKPIPLNAEPTGGDADA
ncbi:MAG: ABC transporter permease [Clostridia bacterium]|nr:ABC transporter permease [Clostridia bacterium]